MIVYWLVEAVIVAIGFAAVHVPMMAIRRRLRAGEGWPFVRCARLAAAELDAANVRAILDTERDGYRELMERYVALERDRDQFRAAADQAIAAAQAWHLTARQVQMTMLNMPYWASTPAKEAADVTPPQ